jgi:hypothetical protein
MRPGPFFGAVVTAGAVLGMVGVIEAVTRGLDKLPIAAVRLPRVAAAPQHLDRDRESADRAYVADVALAAGVPLVAKADILRTCQ